MRRVNRSIQEPIRTYLASHAVRMPGYDYSADAPIHLTICAKYQVTDDPSLARTICDNVEHYCRKMSYRLYCYCLMPDHLHVLLSPADSGVAIHRWLNSYKSFTTHELMKSGKPAPLWQRSAHDHVCTVSDTVEDVARYIVNNPIRAGMVQKWDDWPWSKLLIEL